MWGEMWWRIHTFTIKIIFRHLMSLNPIHSHHQKKKLIQKTTCESQILPSFEEITSRNIPQVATNVCWDSNLSLKLFSKGSRKHQRLKKLQWLQWRASQSNTSWNFVRNYEHSSRNTHLQKKSTFKEIAFRKWYP